MMDQNHRDQGKKGKKPLRDRYWSLMLVGDHGRIIPFKRFKGIAIAFIAVFILTLISLTILSFLYLRQANTLKQLTTEMEKLRTQADRLRNEKDVLLARLVMDKKIIPGDDQPAGSNNSAKAQSAEPAATVKKEAVKSPEKPTAEKPAENIQPAVKAPETKPKPPEVKLGAKIQQFGVTYDLGRSILQAKFRIYNGNKPKVPLTGKVVVVFKKAQDPPIKWIPVPRVQIANSMPDGKNGKLFKIKNYRTMTLRAYGLKPPIVYDTAAVYVYSEDGDLILKEEHDFKIEAPPPPSPKPAQPDPADEVTESEASEPATEETTQDEATEENTANGVSQDGAGSPSQDARAFQYPDPYNVPKEETTQGSDAGIDEPATEQPGAPEEQESTDHQELQTETPSEE